MGSMDLQGSGEQGPSFFGAGPGSPVGEEHAGGSSHVGPHTP